MSYFGNAQFTLAQEPRGLLHPDPNQGIGKRHASYFPKNCLEMGDTHTRHASNILEANFLVIVPMQVVDRHPNLLTAFLLSCLMGNQLRSEPKVLARSLQDSQDLSLSSGLYDWIIVHIATCNGFQQPKRCFLDSLTLTTFSRNDRRLMSGTPQKRPEIHLITFWGSQRCHEARQKVNHQRTMIPFQFYHSVQLQVVHHQKVAWFERQQIGSISKTPRSFQRENQLIMLVPVQPALPHTIRSLRKRKEPDPSWKTRRKMALQTPRRINQSINSLPLVAN